MSARLPVGRIGLACSLLVLLTVPGLSRLRFDVSNASYFLEDSPERVRYADLLETFGSDEVVYLLVEAGDAFAPERLPTLLKLGDELRGLEGVLSLRSPLHTPVVLEAEGELDARAVADDPPQSDAERASARARVLAYAPFRGLLIDERGRWVGYVVRLEAELAEPQRRAAFAAELEGLLARAPYRELPHAAVGTPLNATLFARILVRELGRSVVLGIVIGLLCLLALFRSPRAVFASLVVVIGALVSTFGIMGYAGVSLSMISSILTTLLVCVGVGDAMHLLTGYARRCREGAEPREALRGAYTAAAWPCFLTSVTTAAGFLALLTSDLAPVRQLGGFAALGCVIAFLLTLGLLPACLLGWRPGQQGADRVGAGLRSLLKTVARRPWRVALLTMLVFVASGVGVHRLRVDHDFLGYLSPDEPLRQQIEFVQARMGGAVAVEVVLETEDDGVASGVLLRRLDEYVAWLEQVDPIVRSVEAVSEPLHEVYAHFGGERAGPLPPGDDAAAQLLLALQMSEPELYARHVAPGNGTTRITVRLDIVGSQRYQVVLDAMEAELNRRFEGLAKGHLTGSAVLLARMKDYVLQTQVESFGLALLIVSLLLVFLAGSPRMAAFAVLCNILPIVAVLGLMGWLGIAVEISNVLLAAVAIGIVVDDTIHCVHRIRAGLREHGETRLALEETLQESGRAVLFTSLVLVLSFAVYVGSALSNVRAFGLLASATFLAALLADLVLLPALLLATSRRRWDIE